MFKEQYKCQVIIIIIKLIHSTTATVYSYQVGYVAEGVTNVQIGASISNIINAIKKGVLSQIYGN